MNKKLIWGLIIAVIVIVLIVLGVNSSNKSTVDLVKIGVILPLSGDYAVLGESVKNAIEMSYNDLDSKNVQLFFEDGEFNSAKALSAYNKLQTVNNVDIIFGLDNPTLEAIKPIINDSDELMFTLGNEASIEKDNVFEIIPWAAGLFTALGEEVSDKYEKIAVVYATDWQLAETNKGLFYEGLGNKNYIEVPISPNSDVRTEIAKMLQQDIDAYTLFLPLEQGIKVLNEVTNQSSGSEKPQLICDGNIQLTIGEYLGKVGDKSIFNNCISTMIADTTSKEFNSRYKEIYTEDPNFLAVYGYDAVQIVSNFLVGENKSDWEKILEDNKFIFKGMSGQIKFDETGSRTLESQVFVFKNGEFVENQ